MKAYYGQHKSTGKYYAMTELPRITQWGDTPEEAWSKLDTYLRRHHHMALSDTPRPFPHPDAAS